MAAVGLAGCRREERFESVCQITRKVVVEHDEQGVPTQLDMELEWDPCPGEQVQIIRGGAAFAKCVDKLNPGDLVPVHVVHFWDTRGFWDWDIDAVAGCARPIELDTKGSFEKSQECHDVIEHGHRTGFSCNRRPFEKLVAICPWMARD